MDSLNIESRSFTLIINIATITLAWNDIWNDKSKLNQGWLFSIETAAIVYLSTILKDSLSNFSELLVWTTNQSFVLDIFELLLALVIEWLEICCLWNELWSRVKKAKPCHSPFS